MACGLMVLLGACSKDEVAEVNRDGDEITFNVVANSASRAADVYCNYNMMDGFYVSAITDGQTYIDQDNIKHESGKWTNASGTRYWPEGTVDFYASNNNGYTWNVADGALSAPQFVDYTVGTTVAEQEDLLYAVKTGAKEEDGDVTLNFRHALSQIVFKAKNINPNLYVEVTGVRVANVGDKNTFTFPTVSTDANIESHDGSIKNDYPETALGWGTWNGLTAGTAIYATAFDAVKLNGAKDAEAQSLTDAGDAAADYANTLLLLPQNTTAWEPSTTYPVPTTVGQTGSYFLVNCVIYNVKGDVVDLEGDDKDVLLWGTEEGGPKEIAIPVAFNWDQGKKYIYTFVFGDGNGGYDPEPEPDPDPDPDPVLVPITFNVTVDDFVVVESDIEMETQENATTEDEGQGN